MKYSAPLSVLALVLLVPYVAACQETPTLPRSNAPEDAQVYNSAPADGEPVSATFSVKFGLQAMGIAPAGIEMENTGHHHLLVDLDAMPNVGLPLPATDNIRHFGKGQTETTLTLPPGTHTLQLLLGDHIHIPHDPPVMSEKITITVK